MTPIPIFDITGRSLRRVLGPPPTLAPLPAPVDPNAYSRFWDLHLTDKQGWYDFALNILPEIRYQEQKNLLNRSWLPGDGRVRVSWRIAQAFRASLREQQVGLSDLVDFASARRADVAALGAAPANAFLVRLQSTHKARMDELHRVHQQPEVSKQLSAFTTLMFDLESLMRQHFRNPSLNPVGFQQIIVRLTHMRSTLQDFKDQLANLESRLETFNPDEGYSPNSSYFTTIISMDDLTRQIPSGLGEVMVRWIADWSHRGKLRVSSHGDGKGHLNMEADEVSGARVADWLYQNGLEENLQPIGQRQDRAGLKAEHGLITINLSICMGGRAFDDQTQTTVPGLLQAQQRTTVPAPGSALDLLLHRLRHYRVRGIEVTGSNMVVRDEGGQLGEASGDDWIRLAHSDRKVRAIS
ncbi:hypothetical protein OV208_07420 [Corallococcus sp. bb12-1]|nr:hypothetical protein [Corallococcus sp. bb12-1]